MVRKFVYHAGRIYEIGVVDFNYPTHTKYVLEADYAALEHDSHITAQALNSAMDMISDLDAKLAEQDAELETLRGELRNALAEVAYANEDRQC